MCLGAGQKKSDAAGITLPANLRTGAQVAPLHCLILRHGQKHLDDTTDSLKFQAPYCPAIMALTVRELRPCWPPNAVICSLLSLFVLPYFPSMDSPPQPDKQQSKTSWQTGPMATVGLSGCLLSIPIYIGSYVALAALISLEQVPRVNLLFYVIQHRIISICNNCIRPGLELLNIIDNKAAKESRSVL